MRAGIFTGCRRPSEPVDGCKWRQPRSLWHGLVNSSTPTVRPATKPCTKTQSQPRSVRKSPTYSRSEPRRDRFASRVPRNPPDVDRATSFLTRRGTENRVVAAVCFSPESASVRSITPRSFRLVCAIVFAIVHRDRSRIPEYADPSYRSQQQGPPSLLASLLSKVRDRSATGSFHQLRFAITAMILLVPRRCALTFDIRRALSGDPLIDHCDLRVNYPRLARSLDRIIAREPRRRFRSVRHVSSDSETCTAEEKGNDDLVHERLGTR